MPRNPSVYRSTEAPTDPTQGDLLVRASDNAVRVYNGTAWVALPSTSLTLTDAASKIVPGTTSLALRNNADSANNVLVSDAGAVTVRNALTVTTGATSLGGDLYPSAGFASTNAASPGWYIPGEAGSPTGVVPSLGKRVAVYYDTTNNRAFYRNGGSWFATPSLTLV